MSDRTQPKCMRCEFPPYVAELEARCVRAEEALRAAREFLSTVGECGEFHPVGHIIAEIDAALAAEAAAVPGEVWSA